MDLTWYDWEHFSKEVSIDLQDPNQKDNNKKPRVLEDDDIEMMLNEITNVRRFNN